MLLVNLAPYCISMPLIYSYYIFLPIILTYQLL